LQSTNGRARKRSTFASPHLGNSNSNAHNFSVSNLTHPKVNTMRLSSFLIFGSILPLICAADGDPKSLRGLKEKSTPVASNADGTSNVKRNLQGCPPNAYLDASSNQCFCNSWDVWTGDACCPANAYFDWNNYQCTCNSNYQWDGSACIEIQTSSGISPIDLCAGDGGACQCGQGGDGSLITLNRFWGDATDEQVFGCGGAFHLDGATLEAQYGGDPTGSLGLSFSQADSFDGWEGCCYICGLNLQIAGKLSSGWYCEKDFFSTGIWLKH
jgi:hypothetical protein